MKIQLSILILFLISCKKFKTEEDQIKIRVYSEGNGVTDIDGNFYKTVIIGEQEWMAENLKVTKLNDGSPILPISDSVIELIQNEKQVYFYSWTNLDSNNNSLFGKLYNISLLSKNVCPTGWHIPIEEDWKEFIAYIGSHTMVGEKIKSRGTLKDSSGLWDSEINYSNNETGFNALPSGKDSSDLHKKAYFWNATLIESYHPNKYYTSDYQVMTLNNENNFLKAEKMQTSYFSIAYSIRCLKD